MPTSANAAHSGNGKSYKSALRDLAVSTISADALIELVEKLGLKDILVSRLRDRIENADIDGLIDDAMMYLRRNPEVLVILLGAITVATGAIVFLEQRRFDAESGRPARSNRASRPIAGDFAERDAQRMRPRRPLS